MAIAVDRFGSYISVLPILRYSVIEKNILSPGILYVIFLHWDENQVYYKIGVYRLYRVLHWNLSQFAVGLFSRYNYYDGTIN